MQIVIETTLIPRDGIGKDPFEMEGTINNGTTSFDSYLRRCDVSNGCVFGNGNVFPIYISDVF